jgi:hypothetical protein
MDPRVKPAGDGLGFFRSNFSAVIAGFDPAIHHLAIERFNLASPAK